MGPFAGIDIARTGLGFNKYWLDTIAQNVANVNTASTPGQDVFRARMVVAMPIAQDQAPGGGVFVGDVVDQQGDPTLVDDPTNPLADENGNVAQAVVDLPGQMGDLIIASRAYQANMSVFSTARDALETATTLGRRVMTAMIPPTGAMPAVTGISGIAGLSPTGAPSATSGFGNALTAGLDNVSGLERAADQAVASFAAGGSLQITDVMAATAKANLGVTIVNEIRNRGLEAYQSILNVQV